MPTPGRRCASMCSMSLTVVVSARSERGDDAPRHAVGRQAGVLPDDADDRDADIGKDVGGRAQRRERADDQDQQRQHDEGVGPRERNADKGDHRPGSPITPENGMGQPKSSRGRRANAKPRPITIACSRGVERSAAEAGGRREERRGERCMVAPAWVRARRRLEFAGFVAVDLGFPCDRAEAANGGPW